MKVQEIKREVIYELNFDDSEATHLMHICWFALDYEAEHKGSLTEAELDLAIKIKEYFEKELVRETKEL